MASPDISATEWIYVYACVLTLTLMAGFAVLRVLLPPRKSDKKDDK